MQYIDVHCHLNDEAFEDSLPQTLRAMAASKIEFALCAGCDMPSSERAKEIAEKYENVYFCVGFQPEEVNKYREGDIEKLKMLSSHPKCVAIGEIGLDYHWENNPAKDLQKQLFIWQLELANETDLPVVIHSRDSAEDMQTLLTEHKNLLGNGFLLHCYSHSAEQSAVFEKLGGYFSFGGTATFENSKKVVKSVARVSGERILTETDSPYLTPVPHRGEFPNTPANIPYIAQKLAQIRGIDEETLCRQVVENAHRLFKKWR